MARHTLYYGSIRIFVRMFISLEVEITLYEATGKVSSPGHFLVKQNMANTSNILFANHKMSLEFNII